MDKSDLLKKAETLRAEWLHSSDSIFHHDGVASREYGYEWTAGFMAGVEVAKAEEAKK